MTIQTIQQKNGGSKILFETVRRNELKHHVYFQNGWHLKLVWTSCKLHHKWFRDFNKNTSTSNLSNKDLQDEFLKKLHPSLATEATHRYLPLSWYLLQRHLDQVFPALKVMPFQVDRSIAWNNGGVSENRVFSPQIIPFLEGFPL